MTMVAAIAVAFVACSEDEKSDEKPETPEKVSIDDNAVNLGLPSGTKWAKMNIGATNAWDRGDNFAWGETRPKEVYDYSNYLHLTADAKFEQEWKYINKYQIDDGYDGIWYRNIEFVGDGKSVLEPEDDAAAVNWGGDWVMPTPEDFIELRENCEIEKTSEYNGVRGVLFKGKNGNTVFFPKGGGKTLNSDPLFIDYGFYWTNSIETTEEAYKEVLADVEELFWNPSLRTNGLLVRGVCKAGGNTNNHDAVDLGLPSGKLWATMNIGAEKAEDNGYYLAWGETAPKKLYDEATYKFVTKAGKSRSISKYQIDDKIVGGVWYTKEFIGDGKATLEDIDDAAVVNWEGNWKTPTEAQFDELMRNCCIIWTDNYDDSNVAGYVVYKAKADPDKGRIITDSKDKGTLVKYYTLTDTHVFFPKSFYWTNTVYYYTYSALAYELSGSRGSVDRSEGLHIRPVCK